MNTKLLMTSSAIFYGIIGFGLTFLPEEISSYFGSQLSKISFLIYQILGGVYLGFSMLNWMTKNNLIGGIYSKPLVIGNLAHFLMSAIALLKGTGLENRSAVIIILAIFYSIFTLLFGYIFLTNPGQIQKKQV